MVGPPGLCYWCAVISLLTQRIRRIFVIALVVALSALEAGGDDDGDAWRTGNPDAQVMDPDEVPFPDADPRPHDEVPVPGDKPRQHDGIKFPDAEPRDPDEVDLPDAKPRAHDVIPFPDAKPNDPDEIDPDDDGF